MSEGSNVKALKLGVKCSPPSLIFQYKIMKTTKIRTMPVRDLTKNTDCYKLAKQIKTRHERYLSGIPNVRIEKFIRILQGVSFLTIQQCMSHFINFIQ